MHCNGYGCDVCSGSGYVRTKKSKECSVCSGKGFLRFGLFKSTCSLCKGFGVLYVAN